MKSLALPFLAVAPLFAVTLPLGTPLEIRLVTPVSTATSSTAAASHNKDKVEAILIAPVTLGDRDVLAPGATLSGTVVAVTPPTADQPASLKLLFARLTTGTATYRISATVYRVDNVRESVNAAGLIQGISPKDTITGRMDQGLTKLNHSRYSGLAQALETAKGFLLKDADPNIIYEAGTEMTLRFAKSLEVPDARLPPPFPPVPDDGHLAELVNNQTWRTATGHPERPADLTNLMFLGNELQIQEAFRLAGWVGANALSGASKFETARAIIEQRGYKEAPVSLITLDRQAPVFVMQKTNNTFASRHHLRIWRSPDTYQGQTVWLCSATHDIGIDYSPKDQTFIHKIDPDIDLERRKVVTDLSFTGKVRGATLVPRPAVPLASKNATGDEMNTDGRMAVLQF